MNELITMSYSKNLKNAMDTYMHMVANELNKHY